MRMVCLILSLMMAGPAMGQGFYAGARLARTFVTQSGFKGTIDGGVYGGYELPPVSVETGISGLDAIPVRFGAELEATQTVVKGDTGFGGDWALTTVSGYATATADVFEAFFAKFRLGYMPYGKAKLDGFGGSFTQTDHGVVGGVGGGVRLGEFGSINVDVTGISDKIASLSLGYAHSF